MVVSVSQEVFGCWSKVCAPPPAGKGGSLKGNHWSNRQRVAAKRKRNAHFDKPEEEQNAIEKAHRRALGKAAKGRWDRREMVGKVKAASSSKPKASENPRTPKEILDLTRRYTSRG